MQPVAGEEEALDRLPSSDSGHTSKQNSKWQNICSLILHLFKNKLGLHVCDIYIEKGLEEYINSLEKKSGGGECRQAESSLSFYLLEVWVCLKLISFEITT